MFRFLFLSQLFKSQLSESFLLGELGFCYSFGLIISNFFLDSLNFFDVGVIDDFSYAVFLFNLCQFSIKSIPL
jgi:hypothetical protein